MNPVERLARAICAVAGDPKREPPGAFPRPGRDYDDVDWERFEDHARAALKATRDAFDASGLVEGARQAAELDGGDAATRASIVYDGLIEWFDVAVAEELE